MIQRLKSFRIVTAAAFVLAATHAYAEVVNVDFQNSTGSNSIVYSGQGAIAAPGNLWNAVTPGLSVNGAWWGEVCGPGNVSASGLLDSQGNATGVTVSSQSIANTYAWGGHTADTLRGFGIPATKDDDPAIATGYTALMREYLVAAADTTATVTIGGLTVGGQYDIALYGRGIQGPRTTSFMVGGVEKSTSYIDLDVTPTHVLTEGVDYVMYRSVVATDGTIAISFYDGPTNANGNGEGQFGGFQISTVPEPGTIILLAISLISLLAYAWKKQK